MCYDSVAGNSARYITKNEDLPCGRETAPQKITLILPAYNKEISIGSIILLSKNYADHIIVVDDGSSDRTAAIARKAGAKVIVHERNTGKGGALKTGFAAAEGADIIVTMDSDGQHPPSEIPKLVAPILKGEADMVNGSHYLNGHATDTPAYRRFGQILLDKATVMNSGFKITDSQSGFRAFSASVTDIIRFNAQGIAIESEMLADAGRSGLRVAKVEIGVRYDVDCSTISPVKHGLGVLLKVLKDVEFNKPFFYLTSLGFVFGMSGLIMDAKFVQEFSMGKGRYFEPTILMVLLIVVGSFMALTGILLYSVSSILKDSKGA